jgi:RNA polymerase sigma-70 factor, ECF subfamily
MSERGGVSRHSSTEPTRGIGSRMPVDPTDLDLVERARSGDRAAFAALYDRHAKGVRNFVFHLGVRSDDLDDVQQEVFLVVLRSLDTFAARATFRTWLFGVAANAARAAGRRARSGGEAGETAVESNPSRGAEHAELTARLRGAIARLPEPQREAFVLHHVEGWNFADIAAALGAPEGTLRRRALEAREQLRICLAGVEVQP